MEVNTFSSAATKRQHKDKGEKKDKLWKKKEKSPA